MNALTEKIQRAQISLPPLPPQEQVLVYYSKEETNYLNELKKIIQPYAVSNKFRFTLSDAEPGNRSELALHTGKYQHVLVANERVAQLLLPVDGDKKTTPFDIQGSLYDGKYLALSKLEYLFKIPHQKHLFKRYIDKTLDRSKFVDFPQFTWRKIHGYADDSYDNGYHTYIRFLSECVLIACDIETSKRDLGITCIAFSGLHRSGQIRTYLWGCNSEGFIHEIRQVLALPVPKIFQNGLYDNAYLLRFSCPANNWFWDTYIAAHAHYSELPRDLGFLAAYHIRDFQFWKKEGKNARNLEEYHRYCAKDAYATLCVAISQMLQMPAWAKKNYATNFGNVFPCAFANFYGIRVDQKKLAIIRKEEEIEVASLRRRLEIMTSTEGFNAGSWQQVQKLFMMYGIYEKNSRGEKIGLKTDEKTLQEIADLHPLLERFVGTILDYRESAKALSTYYTPTLLGNTGIHSGEDQDPYSPDARLLYALDPAGTDTSRLACRESNFWCGNQIQNQPEYAKKFLQAEPGFWIGEVDNEQSETRCTAYISQDANLLLAVESDRDFHTGNIERFLGIPYETCIAEARRCKEKGIKYDLRELTKRINHGKSYNMGWKVFARTVGPKFIRMARSNLNLPSSWSVRQVCEYLLGLFDKAFPGIQGKWYKDVIREIAFTNMLVAPTGWTRYFFTQPSVSKPALNAAVAHGPQCTSVQIINKGFRRVFREIQLREPNDFRLMAQVHDSILFQARKERFQEFSDRVQKCMENPVIIHGRYMLIPTAAKNCKEYWGSDNA